MVAPRTTAVVSSLVLGLSLMTPGVMAQEGQGPAKEVARKTPADAGKSAGRNAGEGSGNGGGARAGTTRKAATKGIKVGELKVAVLDLSLAAQAHPQYKSREEKFREWGRQERARLADLDKKIANKREEGKMYKPGSAKFNELEKEFGLMKLKLKFELEHFQREGESRLKALQLRLMKEVNEAAAKYAELKGIHLVLRKVTPTDGSLLHQAQENNMRVVLFAAKSIDITDDVIEFMKTLYVSKVKGR